MKERPVSKSTSNDGRRMWDQVDKVARDVPEWVKPKVEEASRTMVEQIRNKAEISQHDREQ